MSASLNSSDMGWRYDWSTVVLDLYPIVWKLQWWFLYWMETWSPPHALPLCGLSWDIFPADPLVVCFVSSSNSFRLSTCPTLPTAPRSSCLLIPQACSRLASPRWQAPARACLLWGLSAARLTCLLKMRRTTTTWSTEVRSPASHSTYTLDWLSIRLQ